MKEIIHGGDIYSYEGKFDSIVDFSSNINPLGIPERVKDALHEAVDKSMCYPDPLCRKLKKDLSDYYNFPQNYFAVGNGAADIIFKIAQTIKPKKVLLLAPTFSEYEQSLKSVNSEITYYYLKENNGFKVDEDILNYLTNDLSAVYICNPNNPTGLTVENDLLFKILSKCKSNNIFLIMDECFNDFMENSTFYSLLPQIKNFDNLIILKAFTKMYAIPGVRLGYAISSNTDVISNIESCGQAWAVSVFAQEAGSAALKEDEFVSKTVKYIAENREYLKNGLKELGFTVYDSKANYIFFKNNSNVDIEAKLKETGMLIRSCSNYHGLNNNFFRIAVKSEEDNMLLINKLKLLLR